MKGSLLAAIIVLAVSGFFGYKIISKDQREIHSVRELVRQERELGNRRVQAEETVYLVEAYRKRLAPERDGSWLVQTVGRLAKSAGIHLSSVAPKRPRELDEFSQQSVGIHLTTSYHLLGQFLSRIESSERFLRVDEMVLKLVTQRDGKPAADVDLVISTFYLPATSL